MVNCKTYKSGFEFSRSQIDETVKNNGLLSMEIEFSRKCNFRCPYCYVNQDANGEQELSRAEIKDVVLQAGELGAKKIIVLGGEPMIYPYVMETVDFIRDEGMAVEIFTNGTNITPDTAGHLARRGVSVVLKMNTLDEKLQDVLSGVEGAHKVIHSAYKALRDAGYPSSDRLMGVSTIICRNNIEELPTLWQWLRDRGIEPYFEMITPQGSASENAWLSPSPGMVVGVFNELCRIDREKYGFEWECQPPLVGNKCLRHLFSCLVTANGDVMPCVGVTIPVGNIRRNKLADILRDSEVVQDLRRYRENIKGPCSECDRLEECYGCRGSAYQLTGDYLASDPLCWRISGRKDEIRKLPLPVDGIVPQKPPMRMVDTLVSVGEKQAVTELTIEADCPLLDNQGRLDETAYVEIIAQSAAAMNGFRLRKNGNGKHEGLLTGVKSLKIFEIARKGETLRVDVRKSAKFENFGIVTGSVFRRGDEIARGEIKIWSSEPI